MQSWKTIDPKSDFSIYNIPFGIYTRDGNDTFVCSRIGDEVIDLSKVAALGIFDNLNIPADIWTQPVLNPFIALGRNKTGKVRTLLQEELSNSNSILKDSDVFIPISEVRMLMPVEVGDYTDFYSSIEHATNVGKLFRDPDNALLPNWKHLPVGYHGRASSIIVSDVDIKRPKGQTKPADGPPVFGPSQRMDFELEMAFIIGKDSTLGEPISTQEATDYIFGMCLFNDWSARDIQKWEYVPLGPFLGKNFASSVSPWIVTLEALAPFKVDGPVQDPKVLPYLEYTGKYNYDIHLTVSLTPEGGHENIISESNYKYMYWNMAQQLAHHTINGCNVRIGDMMASGTISGKTESSYGSMLEITQAGKNPLVLDDGSERKFLQDNDRVTMRGYCEKDGMRVGFGEVTSKLLP
jgi:fumarylacetoacetase